MNLKEALIKAFEYDDGDSFLLASASIWLKANVCATFQNHDVETFEPLQKIKVIAALDELDCRSLGKIFKFRYVAQYSRPDKQMANVYEVVQTGEIFPLCERGLFKVFGEVPLHIVLTYNPNEKDLLP